MGKMESKKGENSGDKRRETWREIGRKKKEKKDGLCNTPKYTLVVFDMFRVFCKPNLTVL